MERKDTALPIDWETALREFDNDKDFLLNLLSNFCTRFKEWNREMSCQIENEDMALKRMVHKLKGASGNLYTYELYRLAAQWEDELEKEQFNKSEFYLENISREIERIRIFLQETE